MMKTYSLRTRLIKWISIPILIAVICAITVSYLFARHEIEEVYDAQLVHSAKVLLQLTQHEILEDEDEEFDIGIDNHTLQHKYERNLGFRIWHKGELITFSGSAENFGDFQAAPGFSTVKINDHEWRIYVFLDADNQIRIETSERYDIRVELILQLIASLLLPAIIFIPFVLIIILIVVRKSLQPIDNISSDLNARTTQDLSALKQDDLPDEIKPMVDALNGLFTRIDESFKREREFTDNAAHELRTPLAAMKTQVQVLEKKLKSFPDSHDGLDNLLSSINRATRMVEQLLALARLQNEELPREDMDLSECIEGVIDDFKSISKRKNISLNTDIASRIIIRANRPSIEILLRNVIDNAFKYTPEGGSVDISLNAEGLKISDSGPGLSDEDKVKAFERFVRADKSGQSGSGLGLAIAKWICDAHGYDIYIRDKQPQGSIFIVQF